MRNWLQTLWPASFRGVQFEVRVDHFEGGRRLAVHEFPGGETHFVEDLGAAAPTVRVTAYVASDLADAQAQALRAAMDAAGAGSLLLPMEAPRRVYGRRIDRSYDKDQMGLVAFELEFVPEGAANPLASVLQMAQTALSVVTSFVSGAAEAGARIATSGVAGWVSDATVAALQDIPAAVEMIRASAVIDADLSFDLREQLADIYNAVPAAYSPRRNAPLDIDLIESAASVARQLAAAMAPSAAMRAFGAALDDRALIELRKARTANRRQLVENLVLANRLARFVLIAAYVDSVVAAHYESRQDGVAAKGALIARLEVEIMACGGADDIDLLQQLTTLRSSAVAYLSAVIADLRPVVTVESPDSMPALCWAWDLYQDPARAAEIVRRNRISNWAYMPVRIQAIAPAS